MTREEVIAELRTLISTAKQKRDARFLVCVEGAQEALKYLEKPWLPAVPTNDMIREMIGSIFPWNKIELDAKVGAIGEYQRLRDYINNPKTKRYLVYYQYDTGPNGWVPQSSTFNHETHRDKEYDTLVTRKDVRHVVKAEVVE